MGHFAEPDCPVFRCFVDWYIRAAQRHGADPNIGPRLPGLLRTTGFDGIRIRLVQPVALMGGIKLLTCVALESIAEPVLQDRLAIEQQLRTAIEALYAFAADPHAVVGGPRVFQAWGWNPAGDC